MARLSGLQREVLSLYRKCLREIRSKPAVCLHPRSFFFLIQSCFFFSSLFDN